MGRLTAMETFVRVVETGSFSSASRYLGIGQSAVSKAAPPELTSEVDRQTSAKSGRSQSDLGCPITDVRYLPGARVYRSLAFLIVSALTG